MRRGLTTLIAAAFLSAPLAYAETGARQKADAKQAEALKRTMMHIGKGDTLMDVLTDAAVPNDEAQEAVDALRGVYDPRRMKAGQSVVVLFEPGEKGRGRFAGIEISPDSRRSYRVLRQGDDDFAPSEQALKLNTRDVAAKGVIKSSLIAAGTAAGVPYTALLALINIFAHEVDFQRDLQPGDRFELLFEEQIGPDGRKAGFGRLMFGALELSGRRLTAYRFSAPDGRTDFFDAEGQSVRRALLATPIDGARLTSGFGMRRHPLLGYSKMHLGTDFGAPTGTPIYAAGAGIIEEIGPKGSYGNYVRIRHTGETATAYAHMSRFAKDARRGGRVDQGDVIGYVGTSGRSTGAHLHYEVLQNGKQINPRSMKTPLGEKLGGRGLTQFVQSKREIDARFAAAVGGPHMAAHRNDPAKPTRKRTDG